MAARSELTSERFGTLEQPGMASGELEDRRSFTVDSLQTDWLLAQPREACGRLRVRNCVSSRVATITSDEVEFALLFLTPGAPDRAQSVARSLRARRHRATSSAPTRACACRRGPASLADRRSALGPGNAEPVRWRAAGARGWVCCGPSAERTKVRAGWGRYVQSQAINELQISDGVTRSCSRNAPITGTGASSTRSTTASKLRIEAYWKEYEDLRPRFENLLNSFVLLPGTQAGSNTSRPGDRQRAGHRSSPFSRRFRSDRSTGGLPMRGRPSAMNSWMLRSIAAGIRPTRSGRD